MLTTKLAGTVMLDREMIHDDLWLCEPFDRAHAWVDLWLLANDQPRRSS